MPVLTVGSQRILYIHVPKTGGTSVEGLLDSYGGHLAGHSSRAAAGLPCTPQHFNAEILRQLLGHRTGVGLSHDFDYIFMTVRDPRSRLLSEYRHQRTLRRPQQSTSSRLLRRPLVAEVLNFDAWVRYSIGRTRRNPFFSDNHLRPQHEFETWQPEIFRLEDGLDAVRSRLDALVGRMGTLPKERQRASTDTGGALADLRPETRKLVSRYYADDFARYDYPSPVEAANTDPEER